VPSVTYNNLPHINDVSHVRDDHFGELQELRALLVKYKVPRSICIRLIHKHFDINAGEAMVIKTLDIPTHGTVSVLRPTEIAVTSGLHGIHFLVDANGLLQPYEYSSSPCPDLSESLLRGNFGSCLNTFDVRLHSFVIAAILQNH